MIWLWLTWREDGTRRLVNMARVTSVSADALGGSLLYTGAPFPQQTPYLQVLESPAQIQAMIDYAPLVRFSNVQCEACLGTGLDRLGHGPEECCDCLGVGVMNPAAETNLLRQWRDRARKAVK